MLILSQPGDTHAIAVAVALQKKDHPSELWYTSDFPTKATESVKLFRQGGPHQIALSSVATRNVGTVWNRRPAYVIDRKHLDPADLEFAELNCRLFRKSLFDLACPEAFWVNPHEAVRRLTKLLQMVRAQEVGLTLPDSLLTNDPTEIHHFLSSHPAGVVYKPLSTLPWKDDETYWMPYTAVVRKEDLPAASVLQAVPGIYQELVPKAYELRVTIMGRSVFTAKIRSQETHGGRLDWRKAYSELTMEEAELPSPIADKCIELLQRLGFVFGCFDFVVTPKGEYVFLEVNQMGQFLFLEHYTDLPLLDAFSDFLIERSPGFRWRRTSPRVRSRDVRAEVENIVCQEKGNHVSPPEQVWTESSGASLARNVS